MVGAALLACVAFASGAVLAGMLGWWLLEALRRAGAVGAQPHRASQDDHGQHGETPTTPTDTLPGQ